MLSCFSVFGSDSLPRLSPPPSKTIGLSTSARSLHIARVISLPWFRLGDALSRSGGGGGARMYPIVTISRAESGLRACVRVCVRARAQACCSANETLCDGKRGGAGGEGGGDGSPPSLSPPPPRKACGCTQYLKDSV